MATLTRNMMTMHEEVFGHSMLCSGKPMYMFYIVDIWFKPIFVGCKATLGRLTPYSGFEVEDGPSGFRNSR